MTESTSISSSVDVAADPATAFAVFTEEVNCWWMQGPINFHDSSRAYEVRIEPGIGGRVVEVYDAHDGSGLVLGTITVWQPGARLAWKGAIDDVAIDVRFEAHDIGTRVTVTASLPPGGRDRGGTAWVRVTPTWLGDWMLRRGGAAREPIGLARLAVGVHYSDPLAAARWLRDVFQLRPAASIPDGAPAGGPTWIEFLAGNASVMVFRSDGRDEGPPTHTPWVFVDDLDAHYAHVKKGGATILEEIWQDGPRAYKVSDLEGRPWVFAQAGPRM